MQRWEMRDRTVPKGGQGFSLIEMVIAVAMILVLAAIVTPSLSNAISIIKVRYSANDLSGLIQSRSTYGRMGIIAATAAFVGPGYKGCPTLELVNVGEVAVILKPYEPICQIALFTAAETNVKPSRYQCATRPTFARAERE